MLTQSTLPLISIVGVSPLNVRAHAPLDDGIAELAAAIRAAGLLTPLIVVPEDYPNHASGAGSPRYEVLAGRRRWHALCRNDGGGLEGVVPAAIFDGPVEQALELTLAENTMRRALHPVEEYQAFAALEDEGISVAVIARDFGVDEKKVRQRLALGRLAPQVRALWLDGKISGDQAKAFAGASQAAQAALAEGPAASFSNSYNIAQALHKGSVAGADGLALFVGTEAYTQAGGGLDESLFVEETWYRDKPLLTRLAQARLAAEGNRLMQAEGWGFFEAMDCASEKYSGPRHHGSAMEFAGGEEAELEEIEADINSYEHSDMEAQAVVAEDIRARATARAVPADERLRLGLWVGFDDNGLLDVARGMPPLNEGGSAILSALAGGDESDAGDSKPRPAKAAAKPAAAALPQAAADIVKAARNAALSACCARSVNLAIGLALTRIVEGPRCGVGLSFPELQKDSPDLLKALDAQPYGNQDSLRLCARAPLADLLASFGSAVGLCVTDAVNLIDAAQAFGAPVELALQAAFAPVAEAYFAALPKDIVAAAILEMAGAQAAALAKKGKKDAAAATAALLARDRGWLPAVLRVTPMAGVAAAASPAPQAAAKTAGKASGKASSPKPWNTPTAADEVSRSADDACASAPVDAPAQDSFGDAPAALLSDADLTRQALSAITVPDGTSAVPLARLTAAVRSWRKANGHARLLDDEIAAALTAEGYDMVKRGKGFAVMDLRLRAAADLLTA